MPGALHSLIDLFRFQRSFGAGNSKRQSGQNRDRRVDSRVVAGELAVIEWIDDDGIRQSEAVTIHDRAARGLGLRLSRKFPVGMTLWITEDPHPIVKAVVRHCRQNGQTYLTGVIFVNSERRRLDRQPVIGDAVMSWGNDSGERCATPVEVLNATEFGLQVQSPVAVPVASIIKVAGDLLECSGSTCYCLPRDESFVIGVHLVRQVYDKNTIQYEEE